MSRMRTVFGIGAVGLGLALAPVAAEAKGASRGPLLVEPRVTSTFIMAWRAPRPVAL
jgi:hypothetical protein